jgi:hypothetical protein
MIVELSGKVIESVTARHQTWLDFACLPSVRNRAIKMAVIIGTILFLINYLDKLLGNGLTTTDLFKIALTYCVPYCVSTYSAATALAGMTGARPENHRA